MKLRQLEYVIAVARENFSVSAAANRLFTSQPGVSKQVRALEDELGVELFRRNGRQFTGVTPEGEQVLVLARDIFSRVSDIRDLAADAAGRRSRPLRIATTHTQARYALPPVVERFLATNPGVELNIHQGTPDQLAALARQHEVDLVIATEALELFTDLTLLPCHYWNRVILVPHDHPLTTARRPTLKEIAEYPLVTYVFAVGGSRLLDRTFGAAGLSPRIALTAVDTDIIKTYVRLGMGIGIVAEMSYDAAQDPDLVALPADHLFEDSVTLIGLRPSRYLRRHVQEFISLFAAHLTPDVVAAAIAAGPNNDPLATLPPGTELPRR